MYAPTLQEIATTPKHVGSQIGFLAVLHTWGQQLLEHPHLHCVVPGGGLATDGSRWIAAQGDFFLPVNQQKQIFPNGQGRSARVAMGTSDHRTGLAASPPIDGSQSEPSLVAGQLGALESHVRQGGRDSNRIAVCPLRGSFNEGLSVRCAALLLAGRGWLSVTIERTERMGTPQHESLSVHGGSEQSI